MLIFGKEKAFLLIIFCRKILMIFFYIPFLYTFHTRLLSSSSKIAWFATYFIPVFITCVYFNVDLFYILLLITSIYTAYEVGYIFNDCELTKKEKDPTLRLNSKEFIFYEKNKYSVFLIRFIILIVLNSISFFYCNDFFVYLVLTNVFILFTYLIYNSLRNNFNLPLYSFLVFCRYFIFFVLVEKSFILAIFLYLIYPFCVTLEFSTKKRFLTSHFVKFHNFDRFRLYYYLILFIFGLILYLISNFPYKDLFIYLAFYFFVYRMLSYLFLSKLIRSE